MDEPFTRLLTQGMVLKDGAKMAKSKGNVVDPNDMMGEYGTDTTRLFLLFAAPPEKDLEWSDQGVAGCSRFLHRLWNLVQGLLPDLREAAAFAGPAADCPEDLWDFRQKLHQTIKKVTDDIEDRFQFNTAIAAVMELVNTFYQTLERAGRAPEHLPVYREAVEAMLRLLNPMVPHVAEELWAELGHTVSIQAAPWPEPQPEALVEAAFTLVVQVNGKVRSRLTAPASASDDQIKEMALNDPAIQKWLKGQPPKRVVLARRKLVNIVV
jgi:leucyl-tRNA synthetase